MAPKLPDDMSLFGLNYAYTRVLEFGVYSGPAHPDVVDVPEPERSRWLQEVAEPWWQAMEALGTRDGLRLVRYLYNDAFYAEHRMEPLIAAVALAKPNGRRYRGGRIGDHDRRGKRIERAERDWGATLTAARERAARGPAARFASQSTVIASRMSTGMRASVAPSTSGSSGVWTRPDSS